MKQIRATAVALALGLLAAPAAVASPSSSHGFPGSWETIDCAQDGSGTVDCGVWGDGSRMTLSIAIGDQPKVSFADEYASSCVNAGSRSARWVGAGTGYYEDIFLYAELSKTGCGRYQQGASVTFQLYHDPGSDTLWEDEDGDGWGLIWVRSR